MSAAKGCLRAITGLIVLSAIGLCAFTLWSSPSQPSPAPTPTATTVRLWPQQATATPNTLPPANATQTPDWSLFLYSNQMQQHLGALSTAMSTISQLLLIADVTDETWRTSFAGQIAAIRNAHTAMLAISPPDGWQDIHGLVISSTDKCNAATYPLAAGIDALDASMLQQSADLLTECITSQSAATEAMNKHIQQLKLVP